ncbi:MAG: BMP family ABC transporter substrate-binding protein [Clostridia bacterium]
MYEPKFLTGAIAGCLTRTDRIGYVADYPISGMIANINAFALGARLVNPRAEDLSGMVHVKGWRLHHRAYAEDGGGFYLKSGFDHARQRIPKIWTVQGGPRYPDEYRHAHVALGKFYEKLIRSILSGSWNDEDYVDGSKAINYWWGMSAGVVDLVCSQNLPEGTKHLLSF